MTFSLRTDKNTWEYGNNYSSENTNPTRTNFHGSLDDYNTWKLSQKYGAYIGVGLSSFVGIEYFFAPKMSVSGEFSYGLSYIKYGDRTTETQTYNYENGRAEVTTVTTSGDRYFGFDTSLTGALNLNFYF